MNKQTEKQVFISLDLIDPNPYQFRQSEDPDVVAEIAESIQHNGLMQVPTARQVNGRYELAFGHTRLAAFKALGEATMPLIIRELTDLQIFELGVAENIKRRDLNPIEQAEAMRRYIQEFKKNSVETGEFFGVSPEKVRGTLRYLNLPALAQDKLASGEITHDAARKLLTIARVDQKQVEAAVEHFTTGSSAEDVIALSMSRSDSAFTMWNSWNDGKPRAGSGLWPLDMAPEKFPMALLPRLTAGDAAKALEIEFTADSRRDIEGWMGSFVPNAPQLGGGYWFHDGAGAHKIEGDVAQFLIDHGAPADQIERIAHLLSPPACARCPFHAVADRTHYCGFKPCHGRKRKAWVADEMQKISKRLKIAVFDPVADGKAFIPLSESTYENTHTYHAKLVKDRDPGLRLQAHKNEYSTHKWTESHFCRMILVGKKAEAVKEKKREAGVSERVTEEERRRKYELERARTAAAHKFRTEYATSLFAVAFKGMDHIPAMCALADVGGSPKKNAKKAEVLADLRRRLADKALGHLNGLGWRLYEKGPAAVAKFLQKVATTWAIKLPADFMDVAKAYEPVAPGATPKVKA